MIKWIRTSRLSIKNSLSPSLSRGKSERKESKEKEEGFGRKKESSSIGGKKGPKGLARDDAGRAGRVLSSLLLSSLELSDTQVYEP